jgi:hypothetical protein
MGTQKDQLLMQVAGMEVAVRVSFEYLKLRAIALKIVYKQYAKRYSSEVL